MNLAYTANPVQPRERLLRLPEVMRLTGLGKSSIYQLSRDGTFPKQVRLSARCAAWPESQVLGWIAARCAEAQK